MRKVELLAPAGDWQSLKAAIANGADAIYFGVEKWNARVRATNFLITELNEIMQFLHKYNVKGYLTFNILIFDNELVEAKELIMAALKAGIDAFIVQDLGILQLIRMISSDVPIHISTQMTITSSEGIKFLEKYNIQRVVLGRENSLNEIKRIAKSVDIPLEVFVHGAICVSYSGQCLTSEVIGGRSANRGECAQACRLPYELIKDGQKLTLGNINYLLSPKDLMGIELVSKLIDAGVSSFKIEGRLKSAEYVANVVGKYRKVIDKYYQGEGVQLSSNELKELQLTFSRNFTTGFLKETNHQEFVEGKTPKGRGLQIGYVKSVGKDVVNAYLTYNVKLGDGVVFQGENPELEVGGRVYQILKEGKEIKETTGEGVYQLKFRKDFKFKLVKVKDEIWKTSDPVFEKNLQSTFMHEPYRTFPVNVDIKGELGTELITVWEDVVTGSKITVTSAPVILEEALTRPLTSAYLREQLGRLGGTIYYLQNIDTSLSNNLSLPVKVLNEIRRIATTKLLESRLKVKQYQIRNFELPLVANEVAKNDLSVDAKGTNSKLTILVRSLRQLKEVLKLPVSTIYADFDYLRDYELGIELTKDAGKEIILATPRVHMEGENGLLKKLEDLKPDGILVRNLGTLQYFQNKEHLKLIGDFALNIANYYAAKLLINEGAVYFTPSYDLNNKQLISLLKGEISRYAEVVMYQHLPLFHTKFCVYARYLSKGTDNTNCGNVCELHQVSLKDRVNMLHPVRSDIGCRNTIYNGVEQAGIEYLNILQDLGVKRFRLEFLEEDGEQIKEIFALYQQVLSREVMGEKAWKILKKITQHEITRGQLIK